MAKVRILLQLQIFPPLVQAFPHSLHGGTSRGSSRALSSAAIPVPGGKQAGRAGMGVSCSKGLLAYLHSLRHERKLGSRACTQVGRAPAGPAQHSGDVPGRLFSQKWQSPPSSSICFYLSLGVQMILTLDNAELWVFTLIKTEEFPPHQPLSFSWVFFVCFFLF